jgi:hypothetical protein
VEKEWSIFSLFPYTELREKSNLRACSLESAAPFVFTHIQKRLVFVLYASLVARVIEDLALYVTTLLIIGFAVKGEIALEDEVGLITHLVTTPYGSSRGRMS